MLDLVLILNKGYCLDNIREGASSIEGAGRGAFATRSLEQGSIIAPAPLLHIRDSSSLDTDKTHTNASSQLLLNYCFGHGKSEVLLCPTTHVTLINHNSNVPNAEIRWSKPSQNRVDAEINFRTLGLDEVSSLGIESWREFNAKLAFEVVATKHIEEGEEIFLDYGPDWEIALSEHTRGWTPLADASFPSNQTLQSAFRHFIPIPDTMFPFRWRSDYATAASLRLGEVQRGIDLSLPENQAHHAMHEAKVRSAKCGVYFAPSNVPNAGFGTYTAVPLVGRGLVIGTTLPVVPVFTDFPRRWSGMDYVWQGKSYSAEFESAGAATPLRTDVLAVNDGALANSHQGLVNEHLEKAIFFPVLDRCKDPGAGAFTDYVGYSFQSSFALGAGEELFVDYGEHW